MPTIVVPQGFSYVVAAAASTIYLGMYQSINVSKARKAAGIAYPQLYAEKSEAAISKDAYRFNCAQRAHQNTLESLPHVLTSIVITGLKYPYLSAALGGTWVFGKVLYTIGYSTGDPEKRNTRGGAIGGLAFLGLVGTTTYTLYAFVMEEL